MKSRTGPDLGEHRRPVVPAVTVGCNLGRSMRAGTRRRLRLTGNVIIFGTVIGAAYGIALHLTVYDAPRWGALIGATHGFLISAAIGWLEIFGVRTQPGRTVEQAPFLVTLAVKATVYGSVMAPGELLRARDSLGRHSD